MYDPGIGRIGLQESDIVDKERFFRYAFGCSPDAIAEKVIVTPCLSVNEFLPYCKKHEFFKGTLYSGITVSAPDVQFSVIRCSLGDRLLGDAVILMGCSRADKILFLGTCGGLKGYSIGDIILCEKAFNGEGFSSYHDKEDSIRSISGLEKLIPASNELLKELTGFSGIKDIELKRGNIFTIGSLTAETPDNLFLLRDNGFAGVDMELSAIYTASHAIGRQAAGIVVVSDLPLERPLWEELSPEEKSVFKKSIEKIVEYSVDFMGKHE